MTTTLDRFMASLEVCRLPRQGSPAFAVTRRPFLSHRDLEPGGVHCWRYVTDPAVTIPEEAEQVLHPDERKRAASFKGPVLGARFIQTRIILRYVLAGYVGSEPAAVTMGREPQGKPFLSGERGTTPIQFNLSHSGDEFLLGISLDLPLGVDVERMKRRTDVEGISRRFFHPAEQALIDAETSDEDRRVAFFRCWTIKEAYVKSLGVGLRCSLSSFDVSAVMQQPEGCSFEVGDRLWRCLSWQPSQGSMAAVVVEEKAVE